LTLELLLQKFFPLLRIVELCLAYCKSKFLQDSRACTLYLKPWGTLLVLL
jgi:hypothetical protein